MPISSKASPTAVGAVHRPMGPILLQLVAVSDQFRGKVDHRADDEPHDHHCDDQPAYDPVPRLSTSDVAPECP